MCYNVTTIAIQCFVKYILRLQYAKDGENVTCRANNCIGFDVASSMILVKGDYNYEICIIIIIQIEEIDLIILSF